MNIVCLDLEGVLVPEVWIRLAEVTGIEALQKTTRDLPDYNELMQFRLDILDRHDLNLSRIQEVIGDMEPLPGAKAFLDRLRAGFQVMILSDTFYEFSGPLMQQLGWPSLFCHRLRVENDRITGWQLRQPDPKRKSVQALRQLNYKIFAAGDSYNDISMLQEADAGFLFRAPERVAAEYPEFPLVQDYELLLQSFYDLNSAGQSPAAARML